MEDTSYFVNVTGSIVVRAGHHTCRGLTAGAVGLKNKEYISGHTMEKNFLSRRIVDGDLILDETTTLMPFAYYVALGSISIEDECPCGSLSVDGAYSAWEYRHRSIMDVYENNKDVFIPVILNGIYISLFSSFELSLSDITIQTIIESGRRDDVTDYFNRTKSSGFVCDNCWSFVEYLQNKFHFGAFDRVGQLYENIFNIQIPSVDNLKRCLYKRNNIAHRAAFSNMDRMTLTNATSEDIHFLADATFDFIEQLRIIINRSIKNGIC